jgi:hypothetical protein
MRRLVFEKCGSREKMQKEKPSPFHQNTNSYMNRDKGSTRRKNNNNNNNNKN